MWSTISNSDLKSQNNVSLRELESKVIYHNFSQDCRNITKFDLFAIGTLRNLFWHWGSTNNVYLRKVESKDFRHNFSRDCRDIT